ncbi:MAG: hypothetical protein CMC82_08540 [Flavobacteriaceae bacterium]|nr:hypothetical protein [Flavobacteriaceae bacterium]
MWIALLEIISIGFISYSTSNTFEAPFYALDGIYWLAIYTIGGFLVAFISRKTNLYKRAALKNQKPQSWGLFYA